MTRDTAATLPFIALITVMCAVVAIDIGAAAWCAWRNRRP